MHRQLRTDARIAVEEGWMRRADHRPVSIVVMAEIIDDSAGSV